MSRKKKARPYNELLTPADEVVSGPASDTIELAMPSVALPPVDFDAPTPRAARYLGPHRAIALVPTPDGWVALTYQIEGGTAHVLSRSEPDVKGIACEKFKHAAAAQLTGDGQR